jgi:hypothetical protein
MMISFNSTHGGGDGGGDHRTSSSWTRSSSWNVWHKPAAVEPIVSLDNEKTPYNEF